MRHNAPVTAPPPLAGSLARAGPAAGREHRSGERKDIQGLRAVAVTVVVAYHLWPHALPGGYVGVDVFFVISGFLITSHLLRRPIRGVGDVLQFWARRVRRLIPAASLVLLATVVAAAVWLPTTVRGDVGRDGVAAALYVENWNLAVSQTDYLTAGQMPSPVQHYWSLSVEEQFYIVWPVLLGVVSAVVALAARRRGDEPDRRVARAVLLTVAATVVVSLGWSARLTQTDPTRAYFVSTTRVWELALGGLLATVLAVVGGRAPRGWRHGRAARGAVAWCGLVLVGAAACRFDDGTPFPGLAALVPTVGTALVVAAAADGVPGGPGRVLSWRPVQWVGDQSYSIYLWHWPLIVVVPFVLGHGLGTVEALAVVAATFVLAALTRRFVEDRLRWHPTLTGNLRSTFGAAAAGMAVVCLAGGGLAVATSASQRAQAAHVPTAVEQAAPCAGAGVVRDPACTDPGLLTPPGYAAADKPVVYADGCWNNTPFTTRHTCTYGADDATVRIAVVGNSHAGHWIPAFQDAMGTSGWQLTTYLQSVCYTVDQPIWFDGDGVSQNCQQLNRWTVSQVLAGGYDLVVMANRTNQPLDGVAPEDQQSAAQAAYSQTISVFTEAGIPVLVLRDTPTMPSSVPDCVALHLDDLAACAQPRVSVLEPDPLAAAAAADPSGLVSLLDLSDTVCGGSTCPAVLGGVVVYFDHGHLSATFARTLAPEVVTAVEEALTRR